MPLRKDKPKPATKPSAKKPASASPTVDAAVAAAYLESGHKGAKKATKRKGRK